MSLLFFVMLMAVGGLAIDLGRLYDERGQMQAYVDQAALSAASQLDGQPGALQRAVRAAMGDSSGGPLVAGSETFSTSPGQLSVVELTFLNFLDPSWKPLDPTPAPGDNVLCTYQAGAFSCQNGMSVSAADDTALFVEVTAEPRTVSYLLLPLTDFIGRLFGAPATTRQQALGLRATAGFKKEVCDLTPLMICNPQEPAGNKNARFPYTPVVGQEILMKASGSSSWAPGDFGLLVPNADAGGSGCNPNQGASFVTCILGLVNPLTQCTAGDVDVKPGTDAVINNGINARFDIYTGAGNQMQGNPLFAPSVDTTKGIVGTSNNRCPNNYRAAPTGAAKTIPFPRDPEILNGTSRFGSNCWYAYSGESEPPGCPAGTTWPPAQAPYWDTNHPGVAYPLSTLGAAPTRYAVYRYEIDNGLVPNKSALGGENGGAVCTTPGVNNPNRDRRTLIMAVVDCNAVGLQGNNQGANVPAVAYVKMFLPEPVGLQEDPTSGQVLGVSGSIHDIYGEVIATVHPGDKSGVLHVNPVLYR